MAFTSHSDLYGAVHELGINRVVRHIMRQRPSLFNYGTALVAQNPGLLCKPVDAAPAVLQRGNPILTVEDPLPIFGTPFGLNFCVQFTTFEVDFFPGKTIVLPGELHPPLADQAFALHGQVCAGLGCPPDRTLDEFIALARILDERAAAADQYTGASFSRTGAGTQPAPGRTAPGAAAGNVAVPGISVIAQPEVKRPPIPLPARELLCFCLDLYVVGHVDVQGPAGQETVQPRLDGLEIQDIKPDNLENSIECYLSLLLRLGILPKARVALPKLMLDIMTFATVTLSATPTSPALPHNPAVEDDQAKVFINLQVGPPPPPQPPSPPGPPAPARTINWSPNGPPEPPGPSHLTVAANHVAVENLFAGVRDGFVFTMSKSGDFGPFTAGFDIAFHLEDGNIQLRNDGTIAVKQLDVKWDKLDAYLGIDIPEVCVGGFCIIPNPFDGCILRAPKICVFGGDPDFQIKLDLSGWITSEVSMAARLLTKYGIEATRPSGLSDLDAEDMGIPNEWGVFLDPIWVNIDVFDIADIVADLLTAAITAAINDLLPGPQWAKDAILALLGPIIDLIRTILGIPHQIVDWLSDLLGVSLGLFNVIVQLILEHFTSESPLVKVEDPFPIAKATPAGLIPIKLPIRDLAVNVNADEMTLVAKVGA